MKVDLLILNGTTYPCDINDVKYSNERTVIEVKCNSLSKVTELEEQIDVLKADYAKAIDDIAKLIKDDKLL